MSEKIVIVDDGTVPYSLKRKRIQDIEGYAAPTDAQTEAAINAWLDEHPEATTTVQDGSVTPAKLSQSTLDYFSSRAYYNVKDFGVKPDTGLDVYNLLFAMTKQIETEGTGGTVFFPRGEYIISDTIFIPANTVFLGEGPATHIVFNEQYTWMGTALSNGGDNCGVMNMTVDCSNTNPIQSGAMTGAIGYSTFDGTSITEPHVHTGATRRNTKNVFAHNIWTNTRYVLQAETEADYTIDGVTYSNIFAEKSCVSVQARAAITNVKIDNVKCAVFRTGFSSHSDATSVQANNIECGLANLIGNVQINNLRVDHSLAYDALSAPSAMFIKGKVSLSNSTIDGTGKSFLIDRAGGTIMFSNVVGSGAERVWANDITPSDPLWPEVYLSNCSFTQTGTDKNIVVGFGSNTKFDEISEANSYSLFRNRQTEANYPALGSNDNISSSNGRRSKVEIYDKKIVRLYLNLVLNDTSTLCTLPESCIYARKDQEPILGYAWDSHDGNDSVSYDNTSTYWKTNTLVNKNTGALIQGSSYKFVTIDRVPVPSGVKHIFFPNWNITTRVASSGGWATYSAATGSTYVHGGGDGFIDIQDGDNYFSASGYSPDNNPFTSFSVIYYYRNPILAPCICTIHSDGTVTAMPIDGSYMRYMDRFAMDATYMLD